MARISTPIALLATAGLFLSACGGDDDTTADPTVATPDDDASDSSDGTDPTPDTPDTDDSDDGATDTTDDTTDTTDAPAGTYDPGDIEFRTVNLLDEPVDLYVRTTGVLEGFPIEAGLAPGEVSGFAAPPEGGAYVITTAGSGDPTCVVDCDHLIATLTGYPEDGPVHTVVLYDDEISGPSAMDLWEAPTQRRGNGNEMPEADADVAIAVVTAIAVENTDFGLRMSLDGIPGCIDPIDRENILIGGNQTIPFDLTGTSTFSIHDNADRECTEPTDGPFEFDGATGERWHVLLNGTGAGDLDVILLPMAGDAPTDDDSDDAGDGSADAGDRDLAVALMTDEVVTTFALDPEPAACVAELIVDAIGADVLVVDGALVDLDSLGEAGADAAGAALLASTDECGVDPSVFGA
jgi:hypothetical protein